MFPNIIQVKGKRFAFRSAIERYKCSLAGTTFREDAGPDSLIPIKTFASEMGVTVRTIERWIVDARNAAVTA
jgi:hypothetical protein